MLIGICKFQSHLVNGLIEVDSNLKIPKRTKTQLFIELIENSRIKYKCLDGFKIRTSIIDDKDVEKRMYHHYKEKSIEEKCTREKSLFRFERFSRSEESILVNSTIKSKRSVHLKKRKREYDDEESDEESGDKSNHEEAEEDDDDGEIDSGLLEFNLRTKIDKNFYHECYKNCKAYKNVKLGFVAPLKEKYTPGERVSFLCHQEHVIELTLVNQKFTEPVKLSNDLRLECSVNGTWLLIAESGRNLEQKLKIHRIPKCVPIFLINSRESKKHLSLWPPYLSNSDLNLRTFSMMFIIGGFIVSFLILGLLTLKFYRRKRSQLIFRNLSPQSDPLLGPTNRTSSNPDHRDPMLNLRQNNPDCISTILAPSIAFGSIGSSSSLNAANPIYLINNSYLPSYEEAIAQPSFNSDLTRRNEQIRNLSHAQNLPSHNNSTLQNNSDNLLNQKQVSNLNSENESVNIAGNSANPPGRSRSDSIRSIQSVNGSIRTNNSIATNSSGNASNGLQPLSLGPGRSANCRPRRTQIPSHPKHKLHNPNKNCDSNSAVSESYTIMTNTNSSVLSNLTNASKIPLRGSCNIIGSASTSSSNQSLSPNQNLQLQQNSTQSEIQSQNTNT